MMNEHTKQLLLILIAVTFSAAVTELLDLRWWAMPFGYALTFIVSLLANKTGNRRW